MRTKQQISMFVGLALLLAGFVLIALAWDGAAEQNWTPAQFPYLISGGMSGLGLIVLGSTIMVIQSMREDAARRKAELDQLASTISDLQLSLAPPDEFDPRVTGEFRPRPRGAGNGEALTEQIPTVQAGGRWERPS